MLFVPEYVYYWYYWEPPCVIEEFLPALDILGAREESQAQGGSGTTDAQGGSATGTTNAECSAEL